MDETSGQGSVEISVPGRYRWPDFRRRVDGKGGCAGCTALLRKAIRHHVEPQAVTIDRRGANTTVLATLDAVKEKDETHHHQAK